MQYFARGICVAVGCWSMTLLPAHAQELRWKFEVGQRLEVKVGQHTSLETEVDLVKQTLDTTTQLTAHWEVLEVAASGSAKLKLEIKSIQLKVVMPIPGGVRTIDVDTAIAKPGFDEWEQEALRNLQAIVGRSIRLAMDPRGEIRDVELDAETKEALRQAPQSMQIRELVSEEGLRELFASGMPLLPEQQVQPNDSWTASQEFRHAAGTFRRDQTLTWLGSESHQNVMQEKIGLQATLREVEPVAAPPTEDSPIPIPRIKNQATSGTIWFDAARGMITEGRIESTISTVSPYREKTIEVRIESQVDLHVRPIQ